MCSCVRVAQTQLPLHLIVPPSPFRTHLEEFEVLGGASAVACVHDEPFIADARDARQVCRALGPPRVVLGVASEAPVVLCESTEVPDGYG